MSAAAIAAALGDARREGRAWRCRCPLHRGHNLTLRDGDGGRVLVTCWGGCDRLGVLAELRRYELLEGRNNDQLACDRRRFIRPAPRPAVTSQPNRNDAKNAALRATPPGRRFRHLDYVPSICRATCKTWSCSLIATPPADAAIAKIIAGDDEAQPAECDG
jgi:hypothetical protein